MEKERWIESVRVGDRARARDSERKTNRSEEGTSCEAVKRGGNVYVHTSDTRTYMYTPEIHTHTRTNQRYTHIRTYKT